MMNRGIKAVLLGAILPALMLTPGWGVEVSPQSPLAPILKNYKEELAGQRVMLPNLAFAMPRQEPPGNAWEAYQKAAELAAQARAENPALANQPPAAQLRDPLMRRAAVEFYNATRTQRFDLSALASGAASYVEREEQIVKMLDSLDALALLTRRVGEEQLAAGQYDNATDNAQTLLALGWHWMSMPINSQMIENGFRYLQDGLRALETIHKTAARPDLEQRAAAALRNLAAQREVWQWKGSILRQFLPVEHPELLLIIRDELLMDADPGFHLYALEYVNELMRQTLNRPAEPVFGITLNYDQRRALRMLFLGERTMIRRMAEGFESANVPGLRFQAQQMKELISKIN